MVGKKIKVIRQKKGMSLRELANNSGVGKSTIFDIEQEYNNPTINTVLSLAEALEVPIEEFFREEQNNSEEMNMGYKIRKLRLKKDLTLSALANKIDASVGYLSDIEKGNKINPSIEFLNRIADALEVPISDLFVENSKQNMKKEITVSLTREDFKDLTELILAESSEENNEISIFTQDGSLKFGIDRKVIQTEVLAEYFEGEL